MLATTVVTSRRVVCPRPQCRRAQLVTVPIDGFDVHTREWLGVTELPASCLTFGEFLRQPTLAGSREVIPPSNRPNSSFIAGLIRWWRVAQRAWRSDRRLGRYGRSG